MIQSDTARYFVSRMMAGCEKWANNSGEYYLKDPEIQSASGAKRLMR